MKIKFNKEKLFLLFVFCLAFLLRFIGQPNYPNCLHRDETQFAYNAYSILKTGKDEWGQFLPLHFKYNGEYHVPVIFYAMAVSMALFGANDIAVRMPSIILGSLITILAYWLVRQLLKDKKIAGIFALLLAVNPWQIINARASGEISILSLFFGLLGLNLFFSFIQKQKLPLLLLASLSFILSYFSYIASRLDIPFLLVILTIIYFKKIPHKKYAFPIIILTILLPFLLVSLYPKRFEATSIITKNLNLLNDPFAADIPKIRLYGKMVKDMAYEFVDNYFDYFSPYYLFRNLGEPDRTNIDQIGPLYLIEFISIVFGFYYFSRLKNGNSKLFIILWLFLTPIVGALTYNSPDRPNTARTVYFYLLISLISAMGIQQILNFPSKKYQKPGVLIIILIFFTNLGYLGFQLKNSIEYLGRPRNCGFKDLFAYTESVKNKYQKIYIGTEYDYPYVHLLWYSKYPPKLWHKFIANNPKSNEIDFIHTNPHHDWTFDKYVFTPQTCIVSREQNVLYAASFNYCKEKHFTKVSKDSKSDRVIFDLADYYKGLMNKSWTIFREIKTIKEPSGKPVFNIYYYDPIADAVLTTQEISYFSPCDNY